MASTTRLKNTSDLTYLPDYPEIQENESEFNERLGSHRGEKETGLWFLTLSYSLMDKQAASGN